MTNPKIRPENRKMDHTRTFGRNMRPTLALGPNPGLGSQHAPSAQQWDIGKAGDSQHSGDVSGASSGYGRRPGTAEGLPSVYASQSAPEFPGAMLDGQGSNHAAAPWPAATSAFDQHARGLDGSRPRTAGAVI